MASANVRLVAGKPVLALQKKLAESEKLVWYARWFDEKGKEHKEKGGSKSVAKALYQKRLKDNWVTRFVVRL